jgi:hypothetical protein
MKKIFSSGNLFGGFFTFPNNLQTQIISSANWWRKYFFVLIIFWSCAAFLSSCKDPDELGLEVQPSSDQISVLKSDTATVFTRTVKEDSLPSKSVAYQLLGSYVDPVFGKTDASFYTQALLDASFPYVSDSLIPDSLVLSLAYSGSYGDITTPQTVHVYQLTENILSDTGYYTTKTFSDSANDLANNGNGLLFIPDPNDSVLIGSSNQPAQLRIPLSLSKAWELLSAEHRSLFADNSAWTNFFKGLYIKTDQVANGGAILYFDLYSAFSTLTVYFKKSNDTSPLHYNFSLSNAIRVNHQEHNYTGSEAGHQLIDSTFNDSLSYIQSMAGLKTKVSFPYLKHFTDSGKIIVNKAELEITVQTGYPDMFSPPSKLLLVGIDSLGSSFLPIDYYEGASYFGGTYDSAKRTYKFNIARHLQAILDERISDSGLYLLVSGAVVQANRAIIGSGKNASYPVKLHLFYTKLPH